MGYVEMVKRTRMNECVCAQRAKVYVGLYPFSWLYMAERYRDWGFCQKKSKSV